jgi:hypothetical protein
LILCAKDCLGRGLAMMGKTPPGRFRRVEWDELVSLFFWECRSTKSQAMHVLNLMQTGNLEAGRHTGITT